MKAIEETDKGAEVQPEDQNIDKIRDILFGVQVREFESNFSKLEEKFAQEIESLRNETRIKLEKLEELVNKEFGSLTDRVSEEKRLRDDSVKELSELIRNATNELEQKISKMGEDTAKNENEIRLQILDQSKLLSDSLHKKQEELFSGMDRETKVLRDEKADRAVIADLFNEMAIRLAGDFKSPESDDHEIDSEDPYQ